MSEKNCLATLKILLTPKELKNILGGTGASCYVPQPGGECVKEAICSSDAYCVQLYGTGASCSCAN